MEARQSPSVGAEPCSVPRHIDVIAVIAPGSVLPRRERGLGAGTHGLRENYHYTNETTSDATFCYTYDRLKRSFLSSQVSMRTTLIHAVSDKGVCYETAYLLASSIYPLDFR